MAGEPILVVDDSPLNLKLARVILGGEYDVHLANDAEQALEMLATMTPRLILTDVDLPGMSGLAMVETLRNHPKRGEMIIVALSGYSSPSDEEKARAAGCDGYIAKPFDATRLREQVAAYVAAR